MKNRFTGILLVVALAVGILGGVLLERQIYPPAATSVDASKFALITEAWNKTHQVYVDRSALNPTNLAYGAIDGMINSLGDTGHSRFLTPQEVKQEQNYEQGKLNGIGVEVQEKNGQVVVVAPIDGSPAQKAGLRPGDIILDVDGQPVQSVSDASNRIIGPPGTSVTLTLLSPAGQTRQVTIVRAQIQLKSVTWNILPGTTLAHVRIATFATGTADELSTALAAIHPDQLTGIVLDLRENPGGLLNEAVSVASQFLDKGNVLLEKNADGTIKPVPVEQTNHPLTTIKMVALVDGGTASGAEIVAGALQDNNRAELVGETTFGTGTVLGQFSLSDGSALLLATQEWLTPSGSTIWHKGLTPNVVVALPGGVAPLVPEAEAGMTAQQLNQSGDQQLLKAISLLGGQ